MPDVALINDKQAQDVSFKFVPGKTYRLRFINMAAFSMFRVHMPGHEMRVIEVDGIDVEEHSVSAFAISAAYDFFFVILF